MIEHTTQEDCLNCPHFSDYKMWLTCPACELKSISDQNTLRWSWSASGAVKSQGWNTENIDSWD